MNIEQIAIANYRVLQNVTMKGIQPFSVFLGANASGKTTFIDAIGFLHDCLVTNTSQALEKRGGFAEVISRGATRPEIEISLQYREGISTPLNCWPPSRPETQFFPRLVEGPNSWRPETW